MIALGLALELVAAVLVGVGLALGQGQAATPLWVSIVVAPIGLIVVAIGVMRARPPRRSAAAVPPVNGRP